MVRRTQLSMKLVKLITKIDVVNIPYKVGAQRITGAIGGRVPINISNFPATVPPVQAGRLRVLSVTNADRAVQLPEVSTMQESGLTGYDIKSWQGLCAPAATPEALLEKLNAHINAVLRMPDVQ